MPAVRTAVLRILSRTGEELTRAQLQEQSGLPETTIRRVEEDLVVLGLANHRKDSSNKWLVRERGTVSEYGEIP